MLQMPTTAGKTAHTVRRRRRRHDDETAVGLAPFGPQHAHQTPVQLFRSTPAPAQRQAVIAQLQSTHGNRYTAEWMRQQAAPTVQRCGPGGCTCGGACGDKEDEVGGAIQRSLGQGHSLAPAVRARLEPAMGMALGHVTIHTDRQADRLARRLDAEAFTTGSDVYFREGRFQPDSADGLHLLAHELAHVGQQARGEVGGAPQASGLHVTAANDAHEQAAERTAAATVRAVHSGAPAATPVAPATVQRHTAGVIQRRTIEKRGPDTAGWGGPNSVVRFNPRAEHYVGNNLVDTRTYEGFQREQFHVQPGTPGIVRINVDMDWSRDNGNAPGGGGGTPPGGLAAEICKRVPPQYRKACEAASDPEQFLKDLLGSNAGKEVEDFICSVLPVPGFLCKMMMSILPLDDLINWIINELGLGGGGGKKQPPQPAAPSTGRAKATLDVYYDFTPEKKIALFGPPAIAMTQGTGAKLEIPVQATKDQTPQGAMAYLAPLIRSDGTKNVGGEQQESAFAWQEMFGAELTLPPVPKKYYECLHAAGPFHIGSDKFMKPADEDKKIYDWWKRQPLVVKQKIEAGEVPVKVVGRASTTGNYDFNRELSQKRAAHVKHILEAFAGSSADIVTYGLGEYEAPTPDNVEQAGERRADIEISHTFEGDDAVLILDECVCPTAETFTPECQILA